MRIIEPSAEIVTFTPSPLEVIERAGRTCYLSEPKGDPEGFIADKIRKGHESILEHASVTVRFVVNRATSHQTVRHRIASVSQESQRYCNYSKDKFDGQLGFIKSPFDESAEKKPVRGPDGVEVYILNPFDVWMWHMAFTEWSYSTLLKMGVKPEEAREVLPNATKTEFLFTANMREWRHFFKLRADSHADPRMREVAVPLLYAFWGLWPCLFNDIVEEKKK